MPVDPFLVPSLPVPLLPDLLDVPFLRAQAETQANAQLFELAEPGPDNVVKRVHWIEVDGGHIGVAVYQPAEPSGLLPAHLYFHGGGWVGGSGLDASSEIVGRERAVGARCVAITVDYRKVPEHPYPVALRDCQAALSWVVAHAEEIGVDASMITVGGDSAGGNLAAALCIKNRDEDGPVVSFQLLEVPALDLTLSLASHADERLGADFALHRLDVDRLVTLYLGAGGHPSDPYVSPLQAHSHAGLPPAYLLAAEYDLLRDDAVEYARRLNAAGVPAKASLQRGHVHSSKAYTKVLKSARAWRDEALGVLRLAHSGDLAAALSYRER